MGGFFYSNGDVQKRPEGGGWFVDCYALSDVYGAQKVLGWEKNGREQMFEMKSNI
jgi:hypothetical protein